MVKLTVLLPPDIMEWLRDVAREERRSVNGQVEVIFREERKRRDDARDLPDSQHRDR